MIQRELTDDERARIAERYPRTRVVDRVIWAAAVVGLVAMVVFVAWSGLIRSDPPVSAMVRAFETAELSTSAEVVVQRKDPAQAATCFLHVQAHNYERVGELELDVPPGTEMLTVLHVEIRTIREGTAVSVENCRTSP